MQEVKRSLLPGADMFKQVLFSDRGNFFKRYRHIIIDTYLSFTNQLNKLKDIVNSKSKSRVFSLVLDEPLSDWSLLQPIFGHIRSLGRRYRVRSTRYLAFGCLLLHWLAVDSIALIALLLPLRRDQPIYVSWISQLCPSL